MKALKIGIFILLLNIFAINVFAEGNKWYGDTYNYFVENKVIEQGYNMEETLCRGESAELLVKTNLFGYNRNVINPFIDIEIKDEYYDDIIILNRLHVYEGIEEKGKLRAKPNEELTRQQAAVFLVRAFGLKSTEDNSKIYFTDKDSISDYAVKAVDTCAQLGIIKGYEDGSFKPQKSLTRAEFLTMVQKIINQLPEDFGKIPLETSFDETQRSKDILVSDPKLYIDEDDVRLKLSYNLTNLTNLRYSVGGSDMQVEVKKGGKWYVVDFKDSADFDDYGLSLSPDKKSEYTYSLGTYYNDFEKGEYRLAIIVYSEKAQGYYKFTDRYDDFVTVEFNIE